MSVPVRILHLEDNPLDAQLVQLALEAEENQLTSTVNYVRGEKEFLEALREKNFDVILSDYRMPLFDGEQAMRAAQEFCPEIPFIMVTGELGEERVIEMLQRGATDYVLKDRIFRLVPAIKRALAEAETERKRRHAEAALRESEERLRAMFNNAAVGIVEVDADDRFIAVNDRTCQILGYRRDELLRLRVIDLTAPSDLSRTDELNSQLFQGRIDKFACEKRYIRKDGSPVWVHVTVSAARDSRGRFVRATGTIEDISERKAAEEALEVERGKLQTAFESMDLGVAISDASGKLLSMNPAALRLFSFARSEDMHRRFQEYANEWEFSYPNGNVMPMDEWPAARAIRGEFVKDFEVLAKHLHNGREWFATCNVAPVYNREGAVEQIVFTFLDITDRKRAEEHIRDIARFPDENSSPVLRVRADGTLLYANAASSRLLRAWSAGVGEKLPSELVNRILPKPGETRQRSIDISVHRGLYSATVAPVPERGYINLYVRDVTLQRAMERTLRESESRFRFTLSGSPISVFTLGRDFRFTWMYNPMLGLQPGDVAGKTVGEVLPEAFAAAVQPIHQRAVETGQSVQDTIRIQWKDGVRYFTYRANPFRSAEGEITGLTIVSIDNTEEKQAQELARRQAELLDLSPDATMVLDAAGGAITYWGKGAEALYGFPASEALGVAAHKLLATEFPVSCEEIKSVLLASGHWSGELLHRTRTGSTVAVQSRWLLKRDDQGVPLEIIESNVDITGRKQMEENLVEARREAERRANEAEEERRILDAIMDHIPEGITIAGAPDVTLLKTSRHGEALLGAGAASAAGMPIDDWLARTKYFLADGVTPARKEDLPLWRAAKHGELINGLELVVLRPSGDQLQILCNAGPIRDREGKISGAVVAWRDISDRKRAEEAIRQSEERLRNHIENSPLAVVEWDKDYTVTRWSKEATRMFGWTAGDTLGKPIMDLHLIHPDDLPLVGGTMDRLSSGAERTVVSENRNVTREGKIIQCIWYNSVLTDADGHMSSVMSLVHDVTREKNATLAMQKAVNSLHVLVANSRESMVLLDEEGVVLGASKRAAESFGCDPVDLEQMSWTRFVPGEQMMPARFFFADLMRDPRKGITAALRLNPLKGKTSLYSLRASQVALGQSHGYLIHIEPVFPSAEGLPGPAS